MVDEYSNTEIILSLQGAARCYPELAELLEEAAERIALLEERIAIMDEEAAGADDLEWPGEDDL